jgi:branched-chain amino acid transport system substrate-binding protein
VMKPAGFDNSQGILSATYMMDPADLQWKDNAAMKEWVAFMDKYSPGANKTDGFSLLGYNLSMYGYNLARTLIQVLTQCGNDLTRENVMKQAASLKDFVPGPLLPGIKINTSRTDFFPIEQMQLMKFEGETWKLFGPVMTGAVNG